MNTITKTERRILTPAERQGLSERIQEEEFERTETETHYPVGSSRGLSAQARKIKKVLADGEPGSISEHERNALEKEAKALKEWLIVRLTPRKYLSKRMSKDGVMDTETQKIVQEHAKTEMGVEFQEKAQRYKFIMRQLERPEEANLENIRPRS